jgi:hypothetical protein
VTIKTPAARAAAPAIAAKDDKPKDTKETVPDTKKDDNAPTTNTPQARITPVIRWSGGGRGGHRGR